MPLSRWAPAFGGALILRESAVLVLHLQPWRIGRGEVFILHLTEFILCLLIPTTLVFLRMGCLRLCYFCLRLCYLGYTALLTSALLRVNLFSSFHSPCLPQQNGVSHILHAQGLPIGSLFLSPLSHSRRNLAPWRRCDYPY